MLANRDGAETWTRVGAARSRIVAIFIFLSGSGARRLYDIRTGRVLAWMGGFMADPEVEVDVPDYVPDDLGGLDTE